MTYHMKRKLRNIAGCLCVTIPKQVCELYNFKDGDKMDIEILSTTKLTLKKARE